VTARVRTMLGAWFALLVFVTGWIGGERIATADTCRRETIEWEWIKCTNPPCTNLEGESCREGTNWPPDCDGAAYCDQVDIFVHRTTCAGVYGGRSHLVGPFCSCCLSDFARNLMAASPDGMETNMCGGAAPDCAYWPSPSACDGVDTDAPIDEGCANDECESSHLDKDPFPVRYSTGRVETQTITAFALPSIGGLSLGVELMWGSQVSRIPAYKRTTDTLPTVHGISEDLHFLGHRWTDNTADRLLIAGTMSPANKITWLGFDRTVTFTGSGSPYASETGLYSLVDRGASFSPRWLISETTAGEAPVKQWGFDEYTYSGVNGQSYRVGHLVRRAITTGPSDYVGFYALTINRISTSDARVSSVSDSLGRTLTYVYTGVQAGSPPVTSFYRLAHIDYLGVPVASFTYTNFADQTTQDLGIYLDRVDFASTYRRFLYLHPTNCGDCRGLLTAVIGPETALSSTQPEQAIQPSEVLLEGHTYETTGSSDFYGSKLKALGSQGPGLSFAYTYGADTATQYDLMMPSPTGDCTSGCPSGYSCYATPVGDGECYVSTTMTNNALKLNTGHNSSTGAVTSQDYAANGTGRRSTDESGVKTTYGYGTNARLRCMVRGDDDDEAFATPGSPDTSACAGPAGSQIVSATSIAGKETKATPSILNVGQTNTSCSVVGIDPGVTGDCDDSPNLGVRTVKSIDTGYTRDIAGNQYQESHARFTTHDAQWRPTQIDGPLDNTVAYDVTDIAYYNSPTSAEHGRVHTVTRHVGTAASHSSLITTYSEYDIWGVPHRIEQPDGTETTYTPSADRLTWDIAELDALGGAVGTARVILNPDGTVRSAKDADGVCLTYEYTTALGVSIGVPTVIKRSDASSCNVVPISQTTGEVEIRKYTNDDPSRLESITRKMNGATQFTYSGYTYDPRRRLINATTLDSAQPFTFGFTDDLPTSTSAPGAPAGGTWKTETSADDFGRPATMWRWLNGSDKQAYTFQYATAFTPRPTRLIRGKNAAQTSITDFVYDDFGRLIESTVPEQGNPSPGVTRYEYDKAGNLIKERVGVNTALVRTAVRSYDSLGRLLSVDHDIEHPVTTCNGQPTGTKLQDEEYRYDNCTGDAPAGFSCANATGKLTIARTILHCAGNQTIKRGRWYNYNSAGRPASVAFATVTGSTIGTPAIMVYSYTGAGRVLQATSPLTTIYGTRYSYSATGLVTTMETSAQPWPGGTPQPIASNLTYRAFGPLTSLDTPVTLPGPKIVTLSIGRRSDDAISTLDWKTTGTPTYFLNQTFSYTAAGLLTQRNDAATKAQSRYYGYDALLRMTCEARGSTTQYPSSADCVGSSSKLAGLYTFHDGAIATQPPDVRSTAHLKATGYTKTAADTYGYVNGSGKVTQVTRSGSTLVVTHDAIGRRLHDYDSFDATRSRRDYTYLPNGQLASISGQTSTGVAYAVAVNYDTEGRPLTITETGGGNKTATYELFYDDASRLISTQITVDLTPVKYVRWHYNYLGTTPIAATREIQIGTGTPTVKRFWFLADERGLIYRGLDDQGVEFWKANWDATGWRTIVTQSGGPIDMWVPFALPGQLVLGTTSAYASGGGTTHTRPPLALNQWRVYDPLMGQFLQPDGADAHARQAPAGYLAVRGSPVLFADADGRNDGTYFHNLTEQFLRTFAFGPDCPQMEIATASAHAYIQVAMCMDGVCALPGRSEIKKRWLEALASRRFECPRRGQNYKGTYVSGWVQAGGYEDGRLMDSRGGSAQGQTDIRAGVTSSTPTPTMFLPPVAFPYNDPYQPHECLAQVLAHEALHVVTYSLSASAFFGESNWLADQYSTIWWYLKILEKDEEAEVKKTTRLCVDCK
jgi:YD repeat-containing protein